MNIYYLVFFPPPKKSNFAVGLLNPFLLLQKCLPSIKMRGAWSSRMIASRPPVGLPVVREGGWWGASQLRFRGPDILSLLGDREKGSLVRSCWWTGSSGGVPQTRKPPPGLLERRC